MQEDGRYTVDGQELRRRRLALEWTVRDLAMYAQTSHDAIIDLEHERRRPRKALLYKIAKALDVAPAELLKEDGRNGAD